MTTTLFDGTNEEFIELVQWALVFRRLAKEKAPHQSELMSSPAIVRSLANRYGYTEGSIHSFLASLRPATQQTS